MTNPISQAAVDAACDAYHRPKRMITNTAVGSHYDRMTAALEAAMPAIQEGVTQRLARALFAVDSKHHFWVEEGVPKCLCGFVGNARARTQTEHITAAVLEEYTARIAEGETK